MMARKLRMEQLSVERKIEDVHEIQPFRGETK